MPLRTLRNNLLVQRDDPTTETPGGILIPDAHQDPPRRGTVVSTGPDCEALQPGDTIFFPGYAGTQVNIDDSPHLIMSEDDVFCREERP